MKFSLKNDIWLSTDWIYCASHFTGLEYELIKNLLWILNAAVRWHLHEGFDYLQQNCPEICIRNFSYETMVLLTSTIIQLM